MWYDRMVAGLDDKGNPTAWTHTIVGQSIIQGTQFESFLVKDGIDGASVEGAADLLYGIPNLQVDLHTPKIGVPVLWWRSVGHSHNGFAVEAFFDEVAQAGGKDPFELRRTLLAGQPRMRALLELVAEKQIGANRYRPVKAVVSQHIFRLTVTWPRWWKRPWIRPARFTCIALFARLIADAWLTLSR